MTDFSIILQRHTAVTQHSMVIFTQATVCSQKDQFKLWSECFHHQGHLYQASFPPVKFQMPAPNANSVYSPKQTAQITAIKFLSPVKHLVAQVIVALVVEQGLSTVSTLPICPSECHASCHELCPMHRYKWSFFIFHISLSKPLKDCM